MWKYTSTLKEKNGSSSKLNCGAELLSRCLVVSPKVVVEIQTLNLPNYFEK